MTKYEAIVATFSDHTQAEGAVRKLAQDGLDIKHFSIIGKGYHKDEQILGFYNVGDRMLSWGGTGAFWGGLWGIFFGCQRRSDSRPAGRSKSRPLLMRA